MKNQPETAPRISVVIPTCHRNDMLALCLDRLAPGAQSLPADRYEVIVTDDGSRSTAQAMIRARYPWALWAVGPRKGPAANRNNGVRQAKGEWIAFTDDDCLPFPGWLESFLEAVQPHVHVYDGKTICSAGFRPPLEAAPVKLSGGSLWSCNLMIRRETFLEVGGFDEGFSFSDEDTDFRERLNASDYSLSFVEGATVDHPPRRSVWGKRSAMLWESKVRLWYKHRIGCEPTRRNFLLYMLNIRVRQIWRAPFGPDWAVAAVGMAIEMWWISRSLGRWRRKHKGCPPFSPSLRCLSLEPSR